MRAPPRWASRCLGRRGSSAVRSGCGGRRRRCCHSLPGQPTGDRGQQADQGDEQRLEEPGAALDGDRQRGEVDRLAVRGGDDDRLGGVRLVDADAHAARRRWRSGARCRRRRASGAAPAPDRDCTRHQSRTWAPGRPRCASAPPTMACASEGVARPIQIRCPCGRSAVTVTGRSTRLSTEGSRTTTLPRGGVVAERRRCRTDPRWTVNQAPTTRSTSPITVSAARQRAFGHDRHSRIPYVSGPAQGAPRSRHSLHHDPGSPTTTNPRRLKARRRWHDRP